MYVGEKPELNLGLKTLSINIINEVINDSHWLRNLLPSMSLQPQLVDMVTARYIKHKLIDFKYKYGIIAYITQ